LSRPAQEKLKDAVWNLDKVKSVKDFMALTKATAPKRKASRSSKSAKPKKRGRK
jgi:hypothetical protein